MSIEDAFQIVAWEGMYSYTTMDPVDSSISNFLEKCRENNIDFRYSEKILDQLEALKHSNSLSDDLPTLFIISGFSERVDSILKWVQLGANLLFVKTSVWGGYKNEEDHKHRTNSIIQKITQGASKCPYGKGQIFVIDDSQINDYQIERGPFGEVDDESKKNKIRQLEKVIHEITVFKAPYISCSIESCPQAYPLNEPMFLGVALTNLSDKSLRNISCSISLQKQFEPLSGLYWDISNLQPGSSFIASVLVKALQKGKVDFGLKVDVLIDEKYNYQYVLPLSIKILSNLKHLLGKSIPVNIDTEGRIIDFEKYLLPTTNSQSYLTLLKNDPESLIVKSRRIAEYTAKSIAKRCSSRTYSSKSFFEIVKGLENERIINKKIRSYFDTIRQFGNIAAHSDVEEFIPFSIEDGIVVANSLILLLEECQRIKLIEE